MYEKYTYKELAKLAVDIQDASNLAAVLSGFRDVVIRLRHLEEEGEDIDWKDDPVLILFTDKVADMTGMAISGRYDRFSWAYKMVTE